METELNFEKVWQLFRETDRKFQETDRMFRETDKKMKALQELFEGQWGKLVESLVEGDLVNLLQGYGIRINDTSTRRKGSRDGESYEFDIIAHDGEEIVIVEVNTTLRVRQVEKFIERLHRARRYLPEYGTHTVFGAMAYLRAEQGSDRYAQNQGLFVIRATGNSAAIVNPAGFEPRKFG